MQRKIPCLITGAVLVWLQAGNTRAAEVPTAAPQAPATPMTVANPAASAATPVVLDTVQVSARLDLARNALSPDTGTSQVVFDRTTIRQMPEGDHARLSDVLLQAPGVAQDSFGQLHVRGDHSNLQYRIDGVIIPESIGGFGQTLDVRSIESMRLITGALPAQYGYRTAGVVDITTRSGAQLGDGGGVGVYGGAFGTLEASAQLHGHQGRWSYYVTGDRQRSDKAIDNPLPARDAIHDYGEQLNSFGYLSYLLDSHTRAAFYFGTANNRLQIPNSPGLAPVFQLAGANSFDSAQLDERQHEVTRFGVFSLQGHAGSTDYRVALGQRYSNVRFTPDAVGDLLFNGVASAIKRGHRADTLQADFSTAMGDTHLLRFGVHAGRERTTSFNESQAFPAAADGQQLSDVPLRLLDDQRWRARTAGVYVQDQWQVTDALVVNYGLRGDQARGQVNEGQLSPRLGLVWNASDATTVHAGYARYFTPPDTGLVAPTDIALYQGTTNALPSTQAGAVKSERSHYFDIGVSQKLGSDLTVGLDTYTRQVNYLQDEGQFGKALVFAPFNYARGRGHGVELSLNYEHAPWSGYFNFANSRAMGRGLISGQYNFDADELQYIDSHWVHLDHDQRWQASGGLSIALGEHARIGGDFLFGSGLRSGFANTESLPAYAQFNLGLSGDVRVPGLGRMDARLALINVFDRVYLLRDGSGIGMGAPRYGPRRGLFVGLRKEFGKL